MTDVKTGQKVTSSLTYVGNCANRLSLAYPAAPVTISSAASGGVTSPAILTAVSGSGTTFTFHLATASVTAPTTVTVTINLTLSNGDIDPITIDFVVSAN